MLAHAEVVVRAPDHDIARPLRRMPHRMREAAGEALEIGESAIAPLGVQPVERAGKKGPIIHGVVGRLNHREKAPGGFDWALPWRLVLEAFQGACRGFVAGVNSSRALMSIKRHGAYARVAVNFPFRRHDFGWGGVGGNHTRSPLAR